MAKDVTNTSNLSVDDISVQLAVLKDDIASLTSTMADLTKAKSAEAANQAKSTAQDLANSGRDKALRSEERRVGKECRTPAVTRHWKRSKQPKTLCAHNQPPHWVSLPVSALSPVCSRHAANVRICDG